MLTGVGVSVTKQLLAWLGVRAEIPLESAIKEKRREISPAITGEWLQRTFGTAD